MKIPWFNRNSTKGAPVEDGMEEVARLLAEQKEAVALTGAGMSVDSGIPAFRGAQGLWERFDPMEYASIEAFRADPAKVWGMLVELDRLVREARPNPAHLALARLEELGVLTSVVTQNIDGLHQAAGSRHVVEFHGSGRRLVCLDCGRQVGRAELMEGELPPRCACGGLIKPDVVFFGEPIPERPALTAFAVASSCKVMLVVGTSAVVAPASQLPELAKRSGAKVVEINPERTHLSAGTSDHVIEAKASEALPRLVREVERLVGAG
jgi:NAD-dependent deacetylase